MYPAHGIAAYAAVDFLASSTHIAQVMQMIIQISAERSYHNLEGFDLLDDISTLSSPSHITKRR